MLRGMVFDFAKGRQPGAFRSHDAVEALAGYTRGGVTATISRMVRGGILVASKVAGERGYSYRLAS